MTAVGVDVRVMGRKSRALGGCAVVVEWWHEYMACRDSCYSDMGDDGVWWWMDGALCVCTEGASWVGRVVGGHGAVFYRDRPSTTHHRNVHICLEQKV